MLRAAELLADFARRMTLADPPDTDALAELIEAAAEGRDLTRARQTVEGLIARADAWAADLRTMLAAIEEAERRAAAAELYGPDWWRRRRREIAGAFKRDPRRGLEDLTATFADAIAAGEPVACDWLAREHWPMAKATQDSMHVLRELADALDAQSVRRPHLLERVARLAWPPGAPCLLDPARQATLFAYSARILLEWGAHEHARSRAQAAADRDPESAVALTVFGDVARESGDTGAALSEYQRALDVSHSRADTFIGLGLLAEDRGVASEARDWYESAADVVVVARHPSQALGATLVSVPGGAYAALAFRLKDERRQDALAAIDAAIDSEVNPNSGFDVASGHRLRADLIEPDDPSAAATSRCDAGVAYFYADRFEEAAAEQRAAIERAPDQPQPYRELAEALRVLSSAGRTEPDRAPINEAIAVWDTGYALEPPDTDSTWAYVTRGLLSEAAADWREEPSDLMLEAVAWLERGLLVNTAEGLAGSTMNWAQLGRIYTSAGFAACALDATYHGLATAQDDEDAWARHAVALANWGDWTEAEAALEKCTSDPDPDSIRTFIRVHTGDLKAALEELDQILDESDGADLWAREMRALTRRLGGDEQGALDDYRAILAHPEASSQTNASTAGYAAYATGDLDQARELLGRVVGDPSSDGVLSLFTLALVTLRSDDPAAGMALAEQAFAQTRAPRMLTEMRWDAQCLADDPGAPATARGAASELMTRIDALLAEPGHPDPEGELRAALPRVDLWPDAVWTVRLALGRILHDQRRFTEAIAEYVAAATLRPQVQGPSDGIRAMLLDAFDDAAHALAAGETSSLERLTEAREVARKHLGEEPRLYSAITALEGAARILGGTRDRGLEVLSQAVDTLPAPGADDGAAVADAAAHAARTAPDLWDLQSAFAELRDAHPALADTWQAALERAGGIAREWLGTDERPYESVDARPVVRLGDGLVAEDTGPDWALFKDHIPEMRRRILSTTGIEAPGIRFRGSQLMQDAFEIELDGVLEHSGEVELDCVFVPAKEGDDPTDATIPVPDPLTGASGAWVPSDSAHGGGLEPIGYVVRQLEAVIRAHMDTFVDVDSVERMIDNWATHPDAAHAVEARLPGRADRIAFTRLVRSLVAEGTPTADWRDVLVPLDQQPLSETSLDDAIAKIRGALGPRLPGRDPALRRVVLPNEWIEDLAAILRGERPDEGVGLPAALAALRKRLEDTAGGLPDSAVLVTPDAPSRALVRQLTALLAPNLPVVAADELGPADLAPAGSEGAESAR